MTVRALLAVAAALLLSACGDRLPDYRYKMTVFVSTPQGEKAFSSVREVKMTERSTILDTTGVTIDRKLTGEAVVIELPSGPAFALLGMPPDGRSLGPDHARKVAEVALLPHISPATYEAWKRSSFKGDDPIGNDVAAFQEMVEVEGPKDLPRTRPMPGSYTGATQKLWPTLVAFRDINDPKTVYEVKPDSIPVSRITIEITDEALTRLVPDKLSWREGLGSNRLSGERFINPASKSLADFLSGYSFSTEQSK